MAKSSQPGLGIEFPVFFKKKKKNHLFPVELLESPILRMCKYPVLLNQFVKHAPSSTYADGKKKHIFENCALFQKIKNEHPFDE